MEPVQRALLYRSETTHAHQCISCGGEIPCDSPEDPQDRLLSSADCDFCSDEFQDLLPGGEEEEESVEAQTDDWEPPVQTEPLVTKPPKKGKSPGNKKAGNNR